MQDYNSETIRTYVEGRLHAFSDRKFPSFSTIRRLISQVVDRAEGVFLWATLVTPQLVKGFQIGDDPPQLSNALEEIPTEMNQLYERLLNTDTHPSGKLELAVLLTLIRQRPQGLLYDSLWVLQAAMVCLREFGNLPTWPPGKLEPSQFLQRLRVRTGSLVDLYVYTAHSEGGAEVTLPRQGQEFSAAHALGIGACLFHRTLDTYLTDSGWADDVFKGANPPLTARNIWSYISVECILKHSLNAEDVQTVLGIIQHGLPCNKIENVNTPF